MRRPPIREPRPYDIPWVVMDNSEARAGFRLARRDTALHGILEEIAQHAERSSGLAGE